jgi:hypothetical protein
MSQKEWNKKYLASEKGRAAVKRRHSSEAFKQAQKRYQSTEKSKQHRKEHPEIYREPTLTNSVARLLVYQEDQLGHDPESLTPEFISKISRLCIYKKKEEKPT